MEEIAALSVKDAFGDQKDPRSRGPERSLSEILVVAIAAILSGADRWVGIATWGEAKIEWPRPYLNLANGVPSDDRGREQRDHRDPGIAGGFFAQWRGGDDRCDGLSTDNRYRAHILGLVFPR